MLNLLWDLISFWYSKLSTSIFQISCFYTFVSFSVTFPFFLQFHGVLWYLLDFAISFSHFCNLFAVFCIYFARFCKFLHLFCNFLHLFCKFLHLFCNFLHLFYNFLQLFTYSCSSFKIIANFSKKFCNIFCKCLKNFENFRRVVQIHCKLLKKSQFFYFNSLLGQRDT